MSVARRERAFLVLGPESSGTRLVAEILIAGGCVGDSGHEQRFDEQSFGELDPIVWRRSEPHFVERESLDLGALLRRCEGRDVIAVVTTRDPIAVASSLVAKGAASSVADGVRSTSDAHARILTQIAAWDVRFVTVSYESLVLEPVASQRALWALLGLPGGSPVAIRDENSKYYRRIAA